MRLTDRPAEVLHAVNHYPYPYNDNVYLGVYFPVALAKTELCRAHWLYAKFTSDSKEDQPNDRSPPKGK
jgi:hypothetical protein